jgi:vanillate O-demethylase monooxygenase subunit
MTASRVPEGIPAERNYPYNCWWVAAFSHEVGRTLLSRWLLDTPVVLFRKEDGSIAALEDRCPHRQAPLSIGKLQGDSVECGYHGFRFAPDGRCTLVPSMDTPPNFSVPSYPVREIGPLVWIYVGDPAVLDQVPPPPDLPWLTDADFNAASGQIEIAANYMLLKENVLDLTHLGFVHAKSFGITDIRNPPEVSTEGAVVKYMQRFDHQPLPPQYALPIGISPGTPWLRENHGAFLSPAAQMSGVDLRDPAAPDTTLKRTRFVHATTPIDQTHMRYFWIVARDHANDDATMAQFGKILEVGFAEDEAVLEAIQSLANRRPRRGSSDERSVKADAAGIQARRVLAQWMARETT